MKRSSRQGSSVSLMDVQSSSFASLPKAKDSPLEKAGTFARWLYTWVTPLFVVGCKRQLDEEDLYLLANRESAKAVTQRFETEWKKEQDRIAQDEVIQSSDDPSKTNVRFGQVVYNMFKYHFWWGGFLKFLNDALGMVLPIQLNLLLRFLEDETETKYDDWTGYVIVASLFVGGMAKNLAENQFFYQMTRIAVQVNAAVTTAVHNKSLRLSALARNTSTTGQIVNLMQLDAERLSLLTYQVHILWSGAFQIIGYLTLALVYIGPSALAGIFTMPLFIVLQSWFMRKLGMLRKKQVKQTDERIKHTNELLQGIRVIKMYAWEESMAERITSIRDEKEMKHLSDAAIYRAANMSAISAAPAIILVMTFLFYAVVAGERLTASEVFTVIAIFSRLRYPLIFYPMVISQWVQAQVSLERLRKFMHLDEVEKSDRQYKVGTSEETDRASVKQVNISIDAEDEASKPSDPPPDKDTPRGTVAFDNCTFGWQLDTPALVDISVKFPAKTLTAIVGPVGSGKSTLIMSLLNELKAIKGQTTVNGTVAFVSQSAWILNTTLRENITFGYEFDEDRYKQVLEACCLLPDLELLPNGDQTEIGERGINLSGGQKQRISIARAAYSNSDIVIFDDPLSALDAEVAKRLFERCICGLLSNTTRIMVTNQLHFLTHTDQVVVLESKPVEKAEGLTSKLLEVAEEEKAPIDLNPQSEDDDVKHDAGGRRVGYVKECGTFQDLMNAGLDFTDLMRKHGAEEDEAEGTHSASRHATDDHKSNTLTQSKSPKSQDQAKQAKSGDGQLNTTEEREVGAVSADVYKAYFRSAPYGYLRVAGVVFFVFFSQSLNFASPYWLSYWIDQSEKENTNSPDPGLGFYMGIFASIGVLYAVSEFLRMYIIAKLGVAASKVIHSQLIQSIINATPQFFDTTPVGRVLARFSKDLDQIDNQLVQNLNWTLVSSGTVLSSVIIISAITPWFLVVLPFLLYLYVHFMNYFRATSRELKRLDSVTRSPVYAHFSATLGGLPTIRAYQLQHRFITVSETAVDRSHRAVFLRKMADRWLALRLEFIGILIVTSAALFSVLRRGSIDASLAGLSLNYAIGMTQLLGWTVRSFAELESHMNSVERTQHYTHNIDHERARHVQHADVSADWPTQGRVQFKDYKVRYRPELELVLKGISLDIEPREKVGVVGRTGAGKSTVMLSLLRLLESAHGNIVIDGVDISEIGLKDLRTRLSIIPQDPVLFSGSVRFNLDPEGLNTDEQLWEVLDKIKMKDIIMETDDKLDHRVAEYGENFSAGQRQLICLARALVRQSRILLLDEATSSVDFETDQLVQRLIREEFQDCTIITIAHRLNTIIDSDRILVLSNGHVEEFDHPGVLLNDQQSLFSRMIAQTGEASSKALRKIAQDALASKQKTE